MSYIQVRGVEHYYEWIEQPSGSQSKPVMVFIHGWAGSARYWQSTAQALSGRFDCLLYDMRGFGRSQGKAMVRFPQLNAIASEKVGKADVEVKPQTELTYELEEYADDLAAFLDSLGLVKVYINAHSMGASIATLFMNRYPQRVEKAILTCSGVFEYDKKAFEAFYKFGGYVVKFRPKWLSKIPFVDQIFMARFLYRSIPAKERQAFLEDFLVADYEAALGTIFTSVSKYQAEIMPGEFEKLTVPTLLVAGEYDKIIPAKLGKRAAEFSNNVELVVMKNTAHFPMLEDVDTYLKVVGGFLN
ncbi:alpha/beta fold hydrolase [Brunnivagina elsteri]|uniref:Alpha/beta hydrolase n=1 Tax=Brunnivagina elsteri CCALA 953 TaxID=987040 RepID=A0A2A2TL64_9CYAN|nr:alpha/beta hydrolase [Calothrix elsteri]PAX58073.1 alpha/beta hydrolase [Calothrix elsteri CCALA 953]